MPRKDECERQKQFFEKLLNVQEGRNAVSTVRTRMRQGLKKKTDQRLTLF